MPDETYFDRRQAAEYLKHRWGLRISRSTLAKYAVWGYGPRFFKPGSTQVVYARSELDRWAKARLGHPRTSTADARAHPAAGAPDPLADRPPRAAPGSAEAAIASDAGSICGHGHG